jgi:hypothetical protein
MRAGLALLAISALWAGIAAAQPLIPRQLPAVRQMPSKGASVLNRPLLKVGDCWEYRNLNIKAQTNRTTRCVVKILDDGYLMETAGRVTGLARYDKNLVWISSIGIDRTIRQPARNRVPRRLNFPLWNGKTWVDIYRALDENLGSFIPFKNVYTVEGTEKIETPAGIFIAVRIKRLRKNVATGEVVEAVTWYSPRVKNIVKVWSAWPRGTKMVLTGYRLKKRGSRGKKIGP